MPRMLAVVRAVLPLMLVACSVSVYGQTAWPARPLQLIVPYPAGGGIDILARPFAELLSEVLHQPVIVIPKPGASGTIGTAAVAAARPDGYTFAFTANGPVTVQPHVIPSLPYKPADLVPICQVFAGQYVLAVRQDSAFPNFAALRAAAQQRPGKLSFGFGGVATNPHLAMSQLADIARLDMLSVPFRDDPQTIVALKGGEIDSAVLNLGLARAQNFRALVTFADRRQAEFPDTPTATELGYPVVSYVFGGIFAPKGLPADIATRLDDACSAVVRDARFVRAVEQVHQQAVYRDASTFTHTLADDYVVKGEVVKRAGIKAP